MKRLVLSLGGAALVTVALAATVLAAAPSGSPGPTVANGGIGSVAPSILGLSQAEIRDLRQAGLSLAQIAERQDVDPQQLVDALTARWTERVEARVEAGALTAAEATQLKAQVETRAEAMVTSTEAGGMQGAAVGAGAGRMAGPGPRGTGTGTGTCDGTGPHGPGRP